MRYLTSRVKGLIGLIIVDEVLKLKNRLTGRGNAALAKGSRGRRDR